MNFPEQVKIVEVGPRDGLQNESVTVPAALAFFELAGEPEEIEWYDTDYFFDESARASRRRWLGELTRRRGGPERTTGAHRLRRGS